MRNRRSIATLTLLAATTAVFAHDEDWRKYADRQGPVEGPIWRSGADLPSGSGVGAGAQQNAVETVQNPSQFPSNGVTLLSQVPTNNIGTGGEAADIWGYTSPSGREYALITVSSGLGVVEVSDPADPVVVGFVPSFGSIWHDVKTLGQYAYKVNESGNGIQIIDLSAVDAGVVELVGEKRQGGHTTTHNIAVNQASGYLYLAGANVLNGGLIAVDATTDPENPVFVGAWTDRYVHDVQVVNMEVGPYAGREIAFCFNGSAGVEIIDVTDKDSMTKIGGATYPAIRYCHQGWISEDQEWLYINDELDEGVTVSVTTTRVFRIHDPEWDGPPSQAPSLDNPVFEGTFTTGLPAIDHNLYVNGGVIFQANYRSGLRVFDATSDPGNPREIAFFDTYPASDSSQFNGAWSVYPYFESGTVVVSDIERGLFVLRVDVGPTAETILLDIVSDVPESLPPGAELEVVVDAQTLNTQVDESGLRLEVTVGDEEPVLEALEATGVPGAFSATVGGFACFDTVGLRGVAKEVEGRAFASDPVSFVVADEFAQVGDGENPSEPFTTNGTAATGFWEFGVPANGERGDPPTDSDGTGLAWLTENEAGNTDVDDGEVSLTTESYDLSAGGEVRFDYWLNGVPGSGLSAEDFYSVEVSLDGGSYALVREYRTESADWRSDVITFGPSGDLPSSGEVRLRFTVADVGNPGIVEGGLDGLRVFAFDCEPPTGGVCPGDVDGDGAVGASDLLAVLGAFGNATVGGDAAGDVDGDGVVGASDLLTVLGAFGSGC